MKAPIEQVNDYLVVECNLSQFSGAIIKEMGNKDTKRKQIYR